MVEVDCDLGDAEVARDDERPHQVVSPVTPGLEGGDLRPGHDDGLAQVLQHEGEGGGGVGQSVRAVEDHKSGNMDQLA